MTTVGEILFADANEFLLAPETDPCCRPRNN